MPHRGRSGGPFWLIYLVLAATRARVAQVPILGASFGLNLIDPQNIDHKLSCVGGWYFLTLIISYTTNEASTSSLVARVQASFMDSVGDKSKEATAFLKSIMDADDADLGKAATKADWAKQLPKQSGNTPSSQRARSSRSRRKLSPVRSYHTHPQSSWQHVGSMPP